MNAERLPELPPAELRPLFEPLQLTATYPQDRKEVDIEITLHGHTSVLRTSGEPEKGRLGGAQVCPVPPVGAKPGLRTSRILLRGRSLQLHC